MRKYTYFTLGLLIIFVGIIVLVGCSENDYSSNRVGNKDSNGIDNGENETESTESKPKPNSLLQNYERKGKECKEILDLIDRGDCFQTYNSQRLSWYIDQSKRDFYFPFQREQDHWQDVIYFEIDDADELSEIQQAVGFDDYLSKGNTEEQIEYGTEILEEYWYVFSNIIPREYREYMRGIVWTDTGDDFIMAVSRDNENVQDLQLVLSHNLSNYDSYIKQLLLHEYAHMLTLNDSQGKVDRELYLSEDESLVEQAKAECPTYFFWSCMEESSYLNQYYLLFWKDIYNEYEEIDWNAKDDYENFFFQYEEYFFNSYQGTSPHEDIAEAFSIFVMMNSKEIEDKSEIKYEKLKFFYEYDELVELRSMILENMYDLVIKDQKVY